MSIHFFPLDKLADNILLIYTRKLHNSFTYDHRRGTLPDPVCSPHVKPSTGGLVVRWVTTGEYPLLYVFDILFLHASDCSSPQSTASAQVQVCVLTCLP